jgi:hypothetical protein
VGKTRNLGGRREEGGGRGAALDPHCACSDVIEG